MKKQLATVAAAMAVIGAVPATSSIAAQPSAHAASKAPNVRCMRLDRAEHKLRMRGFRVRERGGGLFGIIVKADWVVVHQSQRGNTVTLTAGRYC